MARATLKAHSQGTIGRSGCRAKRSGTRAAAISIKGFKDSSHSWDTIYENVPIRELVLGPSNKAMKKGSIFAQKRLRDHPNVFVKIFCVVHPHKSSLLPMQSTGTDFKKPRTDLRHRPAAGEAPTHSAAPAPKASPRPWLSQASSSTVRNEENGERSGATGATGPRQTIFGCTVGTTRVDNVIRIEWGVVSLG